MDIEPELTTPFLADATAESWRKIALIIDSDDKKALVMDCVSERGIKGWR